MTSIRQKTVNALKWTYLGFFTNLLFQPLLMAVLSRLLTPQEFGVYATASVLAALGAMFTELGIGQALVQRRDLSPEHIHAGFTASVILGIGVGALTWWGAPLAGVYANDPNVVEVVRGFACMYPISSLAVVSASLLRREMRFKPLMLGEVSSYLIGHGVLGIGAAYLGFGAMSLVISAIAGWAIQLAVTYAHARHSLKLTFRWAPYRDLYSFGIRVTILRFLEFLNGNLAIFVIARLFDTAAVGIYNRAYNVASVPVTRLSGGLMRVLMPSFSKLQDDPEKMRRAYSSSMQSLSVLLFTLSAGLFVCAPEVVHVLLGDRFTAAVPLVQAFALCVPFPLLANIAAIVAEVVGRLKVKITLQVTQLLLTAVAFWAVYRLGWGVAAFVWVLAVVGMLNSVAYVVVAERVLRGGGRESVRAYLIGLASGVAVGGVLFLTVGALRAASTPVFLLFGLELLLGAALLGAVILLGPRTELRSYALKVLRPVTGRFASWRAQ